MRRFFSILALAIVTAFLIYVIHETRELYKEIKEKAPIDFAIEKTRTNYHRHV